MDLLTFMGAGQINNRLQLTISNGDHFSTGTGLFKRFSKYSNNMITDITDLTIGKNRMRRFIGGRAIAVGNDPAADGPADAVGGNIFACQYGNNTFGFFSG